jgi:bacterioferritin
MTKQALIDALNEDLAGEYQAVLMYVTYAAAVTGPHRRC